MRRAQACLTAQLMSRLITELKIGDVVCSGDIDASVITFVSSKHKRRGRVGRFVVSSPRTSSRTEMDNPLSFIAFLLSTRLPLPPAGCLDLEGAALAIATAMICCVDPSLAPAEGVVVVPIIPGQVIAVSRTGTMTTSIFDGLQGTVIVNGVAGEIIVLRGLASIESTFPGCTLPYSMLVCGDGTLERGSWQLKKQKNTVTVHLSRLRGHSAWRALWRYTGLTRLPVKRAIAAFFILNGVSASPKPSPPTSRLK